MATRALPVGLLLLTLVMDGQGRHQTGFVVLVLALASTAAGALSAFGDLVDLPGRAPGVAAARLETFCLCLGAAFVLVAAAARAQADAAAGVPALGVSGIVGALMLMCPVLFASAVRTAAPLLRRAQAR
ncbi:MAG TPA: hypothetical protein VGQ15_07820 [Gaiellaceae bacterium]|jgi:ABC-type uncharacterized transport system permease subunit|nr:hypothetical protein [Gaiellaceae bacterium]